MINYKTWKLDKDDATLKRAWTIDLSSNKINLKKHWWKDKKTWYSRIRNPRSHPTHADIKTKLTKFSLNL